MSDSVTNNLKNLRLKKRELLRLQSRKRNIEVESSNTEDVLYTRYCAAKFEYDDYKARTKKQMGAIQSEIVYKENEIRDLGEMEITIRIGDLIDSLSKLSGISKNDITVKLETSIVMRGFIDKLERPLIDIDYHRLIISIVGRDSKYDRDFKYITSIPLDKDLVIDAADSLKEHCSLRYEIEYGEGYTRVVLDQNIDDIILNFNLNHLDTLDNESWYPTNLFASAFIYAIRKEKNRGKKRVRTNGLFRRKR